jgi:chloramphenicol O-acetyltransferase type A
LKQKIELENWCRTPYFHFFKDFAEPYFGVTICLDVSKVLHFCKENNFRFSVYCMHAATKAINSIPELKYRIEVDSVFQYETIHVSSTVFREDKTFGFSFIPFAEDFEAFQTAAILETKRVQALSGILTHGENRNDLALFTALPWLNFTAMSHATNGQPSSGMPKLTFGKYSKEASKVTMPVSIHLHHALADGYHMGLLVEAMQTILDSK